MKKITWISSLAVATLLLTGCGGGTQTSKLKPHKKQIRELKDWTWNVDATVKISNNTTEIKTYYYDNITNKIKHFQVFIDSDNNTQTGFSGSDGWEVFGADYLIEDNKLFKSQSDCAWKWQYIQDVTFSDNQRRGDERAITLTTDNLPIDTEDVNIYIEPYDSNWIGEYFTIPLPDIKVATLGTVKPSVDNAYPKVTREELDKMIANDEDYSKVDVSQITDMSGLFSNKKVKFDIAGWDVSHVVDMHGMFVHSIQFNQPIGEWNVSNVTNMSSMFNVAYSFNQPLEQWDVSSVKNMRNMFGGAYSFNQPLGTWDVSSVENMNRMFSATRVFNQPLANWDVSSVNNMEAMFGGAKSFNQPLGTWDVSNVLVMNSMFRSARSFNQDISSWDVSKVKEFEDFSKSSKLQKEHRANFHY